MKGRSSAGENVTFIRRKKMPFHVLESFQSEIGLIHKLFFFLLHLCFII